MIYSPHHFVHKTLTLLGVCFLCSLSFVNIPTNAEVFLYSSGGVLSKETLSYSVKPGQTISDTVQLYNTGNTDETLLVGAQDLEVTEEGSFTLSPLNVKSTEVGSWINLQVNRITIAANESVKIPFTITIPANVSSGQYLGGISATNTTSTNNAAVAIQTRKAIRVYLTVNDDLTIKPEVSQFAIISPTDADFQSQKQRMKYLGRDNMIAYFSVEDKGNVFSTMKVNYAITFPNGELKKNEIVYNLAPRAGKRIVYVITNEPYRVGRTTIDVNYTIEPQNIDAKKVVLENPSGLMQATINLSQSDYDAFANAEQKANTRLSQLENPPSSEEKKTFNWLWIWLVSIGFIIISAGSLWYFFFQKKRTFHKSNNLI